VHQLQKLIHRSEEKAYEANINLESLKKSLDQDKQFEERQKAQKDLQS
jgi:hypothetical protein